MPIRKQEYNTLSEKFVTFLISNATYSYSGSGDFMQSLGYYVFSYGVFSCSAMDTMDIFNELLQILGPYLRYACS